MAGRLPPSAASSHCRPLHPGSPCCSAGTARIARARPWPRSEPESICWASDHDEFKGAQVAGRCMGGGSGKGGPALVSLVHARALRQLTLEPLAVAGGGCVVQLRARSAIHGVRTCGPECIMNLRQEGAPSIESYRAHRRWVWQMGQPLPRRAAHSRQTFSPQHACAVSVFPCTTFLHTAHSIRAHSVRRAAPDARCGLPPSAPAPPEHVAAPWPSDGWIRGCLPHKCQCLPHKFVIHT